MSLGRGRQARPVPASYIDFVAEALIEASVKQAKVSGAAAQALRQKLRYAVTRAKEGIGAA